MVNLRAQKVILCSLLLVVLITTVTAISGHAQNYPDINTIDPALYSSANKQFFNRPLGGYALVSTDLSSKTMVSLLDSNGFLDYSCVTKSITVKFVYEKAVLYENYLYLAGWASGTSKCVNIEQINLNTGKYFMNKIVDVQCDFTKFNVDSCGIHLVTVPSGGTIDASTSASLYLFDSVNAGTSIEPQVIESTSSFSSESAVPGNVSSDPSVTSAESAAVSSDLDSGTSSSSSGVTSTVSDTTSSQQPQESQPASYHFSGPVTVESLQKQLDENALGQKLRILTAGNTAITSGNIGTGSIVETSLNGKTESRYTAVIPGDLDGTGTVTESDCHLLYYYFTKSSALRPSVLNGPYYEAALLGSSDTIDASRSELHPGDILKIKKLIK